LQSTFVAEGHGLQGRGEGRMVRAKPPEADSIIYFTETVQTFFQVVAPYFYILVTNFDNNYLSGWGPVPYPPMIDAQAKVNSV